jgi:hypothetical protein
MNATVVIIGLVPVILVARRFQNPCDGMRNARQRAWHAAEDHLSRLLVVGLAVELGLEQVKLREFSDRSRRAWLGEPVSA